MFFAAATPMWRAVSGEPVNETRRTPGLETSAAPISSPIPCTMLNTPGGKPASSTRSASSEHESGDHSAGLRIIVQPAASAGAVFQVESMNGAFQGVITTAGPAGMRMHAVVGAVRVPHPLLVRRREVGVGAVVAGAAVDQPRLQGAQQHRHVDALDGASRSTFASIRSARRWRYSRPAGGTERRPGGERLGRGGDRRVGLALPAAGDLAERLLVDRREVGEGGLAREAPPADVVVGRDLDAGDGDPVAHPILPKARVPTSTVVCPPSTGITAPFT